MTTNDLEITRSLEVTPAGYELTVSVTKSSWDGQVYIQNKIELRTFRPHANAAIETGALEYVA